MALISRFGCLHSCKNISFSSMIQFPLHRQNYRILSNSQLTQTLSYLQQHNQSTNSESNQKRDAPAVEIPTANKLSSSARLKQAVRDYGATIVVFHVAISLASLGICYLAVSNGVDAVALLQRVGFPESVISSKVAVGGSTFVMSYAVHKLFAPARIAITLSCAPFIVRYLRRIKLIKSPK